MFYIYILQCSDNTLYTGYTVDIKKRIIKHNKGKASKYTRARLPVELVYFESFSNKVEAQRREYEIKQFPRNKKILIIRSNNIYEVI